MPLNTAKRNTKTMTTWAFSHYFTTYFPVSLIFFYNILKCTPYGLQVFEFSLEPHSPNEGPLPGENLPLLVCGVCPHMHALCIDMLNARLAEFQPGSSVPDRCQLWLEECSRTRWGQFSIKVWVPLSWKLSFLETIISSWCLFIILLFYKVHAQNLIAGSQLMMIEQTLDLTNIDSVCESHLCWCVLSSGQLQMSEWNEAHSALRGAALFQRLWATNRLSLDWPVW